MVGYCLSERPFKIIFSNLNEQLGTFYQRRKAFIAPKCLNSSIQLIFSNPRQDCGAFSNVIHRPGRELKAKEAQTDSREQTKSAFKEQTKLEKRKYVEVRNKVRSTNKVSSTCSNNLLPSKVGTWAQEALQNAASNFKPPIAVPLNSVLIKQNLEEINSKGIEL